MVEQDLAALCQRCVLYAGINVFQTRESRHDHLAFTGAYACTCDPSVRALMTIDYPISHVGAMARWHRLPAATPTPFFFPAPSIVDFCLYTIYNVPRSLEFTYLSRTLITSPRLTALMFHADPIRNLPTGKTSFTHAPLPQKKTNTLVIFD